MNKQQIATLIALAFHVSGFIAITFFKSPLFISLTPLNLLVCTALICWTQESINTAFFVFCLLSFIIGFSAEYIGVNTGLLFGKYTYGNLLGTKFRNVPWLIGVQWIVITYCTGIFVYSIHQKLATKQLDGGEMSAIVKKALNRKTRIWTFFSTVIDGSLMAVFFDWVMEPAAIKLGLWNWDNNEIPASNYYSWWLISMLTLAVFYYLPFKKENIFAVHLLLIQFMFFLLLNAF